MNILVSYFFAQNDPDRWDVLLREGHSKGWNWMIDSGAFSAWTQDKPIDLDRYCRFIERRQQWLWQHVMLDVVGDADASMRNLEIMRKRDLKPMGVLTDDCVPSTAIDLLQATDNKRMCVAGATHWSDAPLSARMQLVARAVPDAKLHGLGLTRGTLAWRCPVSTVDSSTWMVGVRFGKFSTFDHQRGCTQHDYRQVRQSSLVDLDPDLRRTILRCGITRADMQEPKFERGGFCALNLLTAEAWLRYAQACHQHDRQFFFAVTSMSQLIVLAAACRTAHRQGGIDWKKAQEETATLNSLYKEDRARFAHDIVHHTPWPRT